MIASTTQLPFLPKGESHIRPDGRLAHRIKELRRLFQGLFMDQHGGNAFTRERAAEIEEVAVLRAAFEVAASRRRCGADVSISDLERLQRNAERAEKALGLDYSPPVRLTRNERRRMSEAR